MLRQKSLTEIRGIAQSFSVADIFAKDKAQLIQAIELKQQAIQPAPVIAVAPPPYDARLMTKAPARRSQQQEIDELLKPYVARGLRIRYDDERWYMACGKKTDEGTLRMPLRIVLHCAAKVIA